MLGSAQTNTFCTQLPCLCGIRRCVCIGSYFQCSVFIRPRHNPAKFSGNGSIHSLNSAIINIAGRTIKGNNIAFMIFLTCQREFLILFIHIDCRAAGYTASAHTSGYNCSMAGHTASDGQDALCRFHAFNVFRRSLKTYQYDFLTSCSPCFCIFSSKYNLTTCSARCCCQCFCNGLGRFQRICVKLRMQQGIQISRINHGYRFFLGNHAFIHQITGNLQSRFGCSLTASGLQHIQMLVLNGKLHILHISVMIFQFIADSHKLFKHFRHRIFKLCNRLRCTHTGYHIFALSVHQKFAHQLLLAGCRIPCKCNTCSGSLSHIAKRHHLYIDSRTPGIGNVIVTTIYIGTGIVP